MKCPPRVTRALRTVDGVRSVDVRYETKTAVVHASEPACHASAVGDMRDALKEVGYDCRVRSVR